MTNSRLWLEDVVRFVFLCLICLFIGCARAAPTKFNGEQREAFTALLAQSVIHLRANRLSDAVAGFQLLVELNPDEPRGWDGLASVALRVGAYEDARLFLEYARRLDREYDPAIAHLGYLAEVEQNEAEALKWYRTALELNPLNRLARLGLVRLSSSKAESLQELRKLELLEKFAN